MTPLVSIGMPVYNGENFITEAINSILNQSFRDFELIICDNASTDKTAAICRDFIRTDKRIRYYKNPINIGAGPNFNKCFELSGGKYFKWAAHDDLCAPDYLQACVDFLNNNPAFILCHSQVQWIDNHNKFICEYNYHLNNIDSDKPYKRFKDLISINHHCFDIFGLIRSDILRQTKLIKSFIGADRSLLAELSLLGKFYHLPYFLFFSRNHNQRSINLLPLHERGEWWDIHLKGKIAFPRWQEFLEFIRIINHVNLGIKEKSACYFTLLNWFINNYRVLKGDIIIALKALYKKHYFG